MKAPSLRAMVRKVGMSKAPVGLLSASGPQAAPGTSRACDRAIGAPTLVFERGSQRAGRKGRSMMMLLPGRLGSALGCSLLVAGCDDSGGADAASAGTSGSGAESGSSVGGASTSGGTAGNAGDASGAGGTGTTGGTGGTGGSDGSSGTGGAISAGTGPTGGMSGMSGTSGAGGSGGRVSGVGGTSGVEGTGDCIDFSQIERGSRDLRVSGTGFDEADGETIRLVVTTGTPRNDPSYGLAQTIIRSGSFEIVVRDAIGIYWGLGVYVDKGKDDACTPDDDPLWQMTTGATLNDVTFEITPSLAPDANAPPCSINGVFDLTRALSCAN